MHEDLYTCLFIGGMVGTGMMGSSGFAITLLEGLELYGITMVGELMDEVLKKDRGAHGHE